MSPATLPRVTNEATSGRTEIERLQRDRLRRLVSFQTRSESFTVRKFAPYFSEPFERWPFTTKAELIAEQSAHPPYGRFGSKLPSRSIRVHQSSGSTTGVPLRWADTARNWRWLLNCWRTNFRLMGLNRRDVACFPFSFGPFLGFWTAFEAAGRTGMRIVAAGGLSTVARLGLMADHGATVLFCTPTYAMHLGEVAEEKGTPLHSTKLRAVVVAGEPGGCASGTRDRIRALTGARVFDHYGLTEVGPVLCEAVDEPMSLVALERDYIVEVIDPTTLQPTAPGEIGELVVTNLGRVDAPAIRYRTGDLVLAGTDVHGPTGWRLFPGGVLGRADDMLHLRGNNLYPSGIEAVLRRFPEIAEFRLIFDETGALPELRIDLEPQPSAEASDLAGRVAKALHEAFLVRIGVSTVPAGTLPRFEMKAKRLTRLTKAPS